MSDVFSADRWVDNDFYGVVNDLIRRSQEIRGLSEPESSRRLCLDNGNLEVMNLVYLRPSR